MQQLTVLTDHSCVPKFFLVIVFLPVDVLIKKKWADPAQGPTHLIAYKLLVIQIKKIAMVSRRHGNIRPLRHNHRHQSKSE